MLFTQQSLYMKLTTPPRYITELLLYLLRLWKSLLRSAVVSRSEQLRSLLSSRDALSHTDESFRANNWKVTNRCTFTVMVTTTVKTRPSLVERARWDATLKVWPLVPQLAPGLLQLLASTDTVLATRNAVDLPLAAALLALVTRSLAVWASLPRPRTVALVAQPELVLELERPPPLLAPLTLITRTVKVLQLLPLHLKATEASAATVVFSQVLVFPELPVLDQL
jgi:hypothetical protein